MRHVVVERIVRSDDFDHALGRISFDEALGKHVVADLRAGVNEGADIDNVHVDSNACVSKQHSVNCFCLEHKSHSVRNILCTVHDRN